VHKKPADDIVRTGHETALRRRRFATWRELVIDMCLMDANLMGSINMTTKDSHCLGGEKSYGSSSYCTQQISEHHE
jgi:hypothetical protein